MKKLPTREEAFVSQNYDPNAVVISGVPEHHIEALKSAANLFVAYDAVNPNHKVDYTNYDQPKHVNWFDHDASPGGVFAFDGVHDGRGSYSAVGARLTAENREKSRHLADICEADWKNLMVYERKTE